MLKDNLTEFCKPHAKLKLSRRKINKQPKISQQCCNIIRHITTTIIFDYQLDFDIIGVSRLLNAKTKRPNTR